MRSILALVVVLALAGCAPTAPAATTSAPTAKPTVTATATPTPTPTATPEAPVLTAVSADGDGMTLAFDDGSSTYLDYFQPRDSAVAALTAAFGFAPALVNKDGTPGTEQVASSHLDFEGLQVLNPPIDGGPGWLFRLNITVAAVRGVPITTLDGLQVGADIAGIQAAYGTGIVANGAIYVIAPSGSSGVGYRADDSVTVNSILLPVG